MARWDEDEWMEGLLAAAGRAGAVVGRAVREQWDRDQRAKRHRATTEVHIAVTYSNGRPPRPFRVEPGGWWRYDDWTQSLVINEDGGNFRVHVPISNVATWSVHVKTEGQHDR